MTATLIGLVYGLASLTARGISVPDDIDGDAHLDKVQAKLRPGTGLVRIPRASLPQINGQPDTTVEAVLPVASQILGQTITEQQRHVVVDANGNVVDVYHVDPVLDGPPSSATQSIADQVANGNAVLLTPVTPAAPFHFFRHDTAMVGGTVVAGKYAAPVLKLSAIVADPL